MALPDPLSLLPPVENTLANTLQLFPLAIPRPEVDWDQDTITGKRPRPWDECPPETPDDFKQVMAQELVHSVLFPSDSDLLGDHMDRLGAGALGKGGITKRRKTGLNQEQYQEVLHHLGSRIDSVYQGVLKRASAHQKKKPQTKLTDDLKARFGLQKPAQTERKLVKPRKYTAPKLLIPEVKEDFMAPNEFGVRMIRPFTLFQYQKDTVQWLVEREDGRVRNDFWDLTQNGALLAMKMGLGKSLTVGTLIMRTLNEQHKIRAPTLYICPKNLLGTVVQEMRKFFGAQLKLTIYHRDFLRSAFDRFRDSDIREYDLIISTYDTVVSRIQRSGVLKRKKTDPPPSAALIDSPEYQFTMFPWFRIILDESHEIRESVTNRFKCMNSLNSSRRIAMTGTPLHNRLLDVFNQLRFCGLVLPPNKGRARYDKKLFEEMNLQQMVRFVDYADAGDVKLPEKTRHKIYFDLSEEERFLHKYYQEAAQIVFKEIDSFYGREKGQKTLEAQVSLMRVLQVCSAPYLLTPASKQDDTEDMMDIPVTTVFSGNHQIDQWIKQREGPAGIHSSKMKVLKTALREKMAQRTPNGKPKKIVVFGNFTSTLRLLIDALREDEPEFDQKHVFVHGKITSSKKREELYTQFRANDQVQVLITTLKLGAVGLNLTEATSVIFAELWYSFAALYQGECRVHRIGQQFPVDVTYFIGKDTLEERVWRIANDKREMAEDMEAGKDFKLDKEAMSQMLFMDVEEDSSSPVCSVLE